MSRSSTVSARALIAAALLVPPAAPAVDRIEVRGLFKDRAILVIDGRQRLLSAGETSPEGVTLVSADSREAVIETDGRRVTRGLGAHIGGSYTTPVQPVVRIWPTADRMYPAVGSINGLTVDFLVDTGATLVSMNAAQAKRLGIDYLVTGEPGVAQTANGPSRIYVVRLARVRLGEIELRDVRAAVHDGRFPEVVLLGMSFLGDLEMRREGDMLELRRRF